MKSEKRKKTMKNKTKYIIGALIVVLLGVGGFFGYQEYAKLKRENQRLSNPQEATKTDVEKTKAQIGNLIELPKDEEPTIANVVDVSKLSGQEFFKNAQNGDKLLVYQNAKKAILFRPSTNKIVEVSTISIGDNDKSKATSTAAKTDVATPPATPAAEAGFAEQPGIAQ